MSRKGPDDSIRTVVLDLDGTLLDSEELILASYRHTMERHRGHALPDALWRKGMGTPLLVQLREFAADEQEARAMMETYLAHNRSHHDRLVRPFPGVSELVEELGQAGLVLAIATSKRREMVLRGLSACGLSPDRFAALVTADDVRRPKPDPEPVLLALAGAGEAEPSRAVFVGDSIHDLRAGRAAGVRTAAVLWGPARRGALEPGEPDWWVETPAELSALLLRVAARG